MLFRIEFVQKGFIEKIRRYCMWSEERETFYENNKLRRRRERER